MEINSFLICILVLGMTMAKHHDDSQCTATLNNQYLCTDHTYRIAYFHYKPDSDLGVKQTVDGTDQEKDAVKRILKKKEKYFRNEVNTKPEYAGIRGKCKDLNDLCSFWASVGECT